MGNAGTALGIIGIIIGAGGVGFAFFIWNGQKSTNSDLNSELDDLKEQLDNITSPTNATVSTNMTAAFNNLTAEFNNLTAEFNNLTAEFNNLTAAFNDLPRTIVVGNWNGLARNTAANPFFAWDYSWLFRFHTNTYSNSDYISTSNVNTRITLLTAGWYRIHISTELVSLAPTNTYYIEIYINGNSEFFLSKVSIVAGDPTNFYIDASMFIYSDGTDYLEINGYTSSDPFEPVGGGNHNRFSIEYVAI